MGRKPAVRSLLEGRSSRPVLEENRISKRQPCPNLHGSQFGRLLVAYFLGLSFALVIDKEPPCPASLFDFDTHPRSSASCSSSLHKVDLQLCSESASNA